MTIGCTRCGASENGEIITPPIAFAFKHNRGCGHGVGPLAVLPGNKKADKPKVVDTEEKPAEFSKKEIKVEEVVKEKKPQRSKFSSFSKKE